MSDYRKALGQFDTNYNTAWELIGDIEFDRDDPLVQDVLSSTEMSEATEELEEVAERTGDAVTYRDLDKYAAGKILQAGGSFKALFAELPVIVAPKTLDDVEFADNYQGMILLGLNQFEICRYLDTSRLLVTTLFGLPVEIKVNQS